MDGVLVVDKPAGPTSHDVVDRVRRALGTRRAGHTGTLDPFATGVLPVCVGKATRLARFLAGGEKVYRARVRFGFATTTDDLTGEPLAPPEPVRLDAARLEEALRALTGEIVQVPPAYSARRVAGRRLYEMARSGAAVAEAARPSAPATVHAFRVLEVVGDAAELEVRCSPGTYVRALARDLGRALGTGAHLAALRRLRTGEFDLPGAVAWDELRPGLPEGRLRPLSALLTGLPAVTLTDEGLALLRHGRDLGPRAVEGAMPEAAERVRVLDRAGALLALAVPAPGRGALHPDVVLAG